MKTMKNPSWILVLVVLLGVTGCGTPTPIPTNIPTATSSPTSTPMPTASPTAPPTSTPTAAPSPSPSPTPAPLSASDIAKSSVRIDVYVDEEGKSVLAGHGSGTILTADGLILTNAHVVRGAHELVVALTSNAALPPTASYYAELAAVDHVLDLALIQITTDLDGKEVVRSELDLPVLARGSSDDLSLGQHVRIFGYPGIGAETVTFTEGSVGGFVTEDLGNGLERIWIKTDADISFGNSGGTAVNERGLLVGIPTAGRGSEMETLGYLRPVSLPGKYLIEGICPPLVCEARVYEPNDDPSTAYGPLESKTPYTAYMHEDDFDVYTITVQILEPIEINLTNIPDDVDYDLALFQVRNDRARMLDISEDEDTRSERIVYSPSTTGTYYIAVGPYEGYSLKEPYVLQADYDGDVGELGNTTVRGRVLDVDTGRPIEGVVMFLLLPGVTGEQFIDSNNDPKLVLASSVTDANGIFVLEQVPRGGTYTGFIATQSEPLWQDDWLTIPGDAPDDVDVGDIEVSVE